MNRPAWTLTVAACWLLIAGCSSNSGTGNDQPADATNGAQAAATSADAVAQADGGELAVPPSSDVAAETEQPEPGPEPVARPSVLLKILTDPINDAMNAQFESLPGPLRMFAPPSRRSSEADSEASTEQDEAEAPEEPSESEGESEPSEESTESEGESEP